MASIPRLSCERCKRRKIRCDKRSPCSACVSLGSKCDVVQRARLPRGRTAKVKKTALEERVGRLESLLKQAPLSGNPLPGSTEDLAEQMPPNQFSGRVNEFLAPEFWATLSVEVAGLRETLDESDDEQNLLTSPSSVSVGALSTDQTLLFGHELACHCGNGSVQFPAPSERVRNILLQLYRERVDCLYKALHWPTVLADIRRFHNGELDTNKASPHKALEHSIYFMSLCSITDEEAICFGLGDRTSLTEQYRVTAERAISEARLLQQPTVTSLQAFVVYLLGHRTFYSSARAWTLLAVAVRVGSALRLGKEDPQMLSQLELQIRRRLWYCIALIDTHASFDRGTLPMVRWEDLGPLPLFFNDMSCFALMIQAMATNNLILSMPDIAGDGCAAKLQKVVEFERSTEREYSHMNQDATSLEKYTQQASKVIIASMHLAIRRPPYKQHAGLILPADNFNILKHATYVLQQDLKKKTPEYAPWAWKSWVPWHALVIILAELCCAKSTEDHELSYSVAVEGFHRYSSLIADSDKGMLWRPIAKLMRRVQQLRASRLDAAMPQSASSSSNSCLDSRDQKHGSFSVPDTPDSTILINPDIYMMNNSQNWLADLGNSFTLGDEVSGEAYDDTQFDWSTFIDSVNMDYTTDIPDGLF